MRSCIKFPYLRISSFCAVVAGFFLLAVVNELLSLCNFHFTL